MFQPPEKRESGEVQEAQAKVLKPSEMIRRGHTMIAEHRAGYLTSGCGCALGAAWVGSGRTVKEYRTHSQWGATLIGPAIGLPIPMALEVSSRHFNGQPRLELADWLESQGY